MAAKAKYSKKLFENLDRAEVRKLAIVGMKLAPAKAYTMDFSTLVAWVYERAIEVPKEEINGDRDRDPRPFVEVDLQAVGNEAFRDGVMSYIESLQSFVQGNLPKAPSWPPSDISAVDTEKKVVAKAVEAAPKAEAVSNDAVEPPKRKRGRPRKTEVAEAAPVKKVAKAAPKTKIRKASMVAKTSKVEKPVSESAPVVEKSDSVDGAQLNEIVSSIQTLTESVEALRASISNMTAYTDGLANGIKDGFEQVSEQVGAVREEQTAANNLLGNALLFLLNSVVFQDGEEKSDLGGIPEPNSYLDVE